MNDFAKTNPKHYQSVNDLTFVRPTVIRRSHLAARDEHGNYPRSFIDPRIVRRPSQRATEASVAAVSAGHEAAKPRASAAPKRVDTTRVQRPVWRAWLVPVSKAPDKTAKQFWQLAYSLPGRPRMMTCGNVT